MTGRRAFNRQRGATLLEFSLVALMLFSVVLATIEFNRMILVYTAVANAARAGARYAVVHGNSRTGSGVDGPSGAGNNPTQVVNVVKTFANAGMMNTTALVINVTYPDGTNAPGSRVRVAVTYPYDFIAWLSLPISVNLGSQSQGIIEF
jgi:Flp pilus assembly protein TadG